jgi:phosphate transport system protein
MSPHYEQRLEADLQKIRSAISDVSHRVRDAFDRAIKALCENDRETLYQVVLGDLEINRDIRQIEARCHAFIARHLPAAGHLRFISSVLRLTVALERAGDYSATISQVFLLLAKPLTKEYSDKICELGEQSNTMLQDAVTAFLRGNTELAQSARRIGFKIDKSYEAIFQQLIDSGKDMSPMELASLLRIFTKVERFSDQAKNVCKEVIFAVTGELNEANVFRILFLDKRNDLIGHLAAAIAWKFFPKGGIYFSKGWEPSDKIHPELESVAIRFGLDITRARPGLVERFEDSPSEYRIVVAINLDDEAKLPRIPYQTVLVKWRVEEPSASQGPEREKQLDQLVRDLVGNVQLLMEQLHGRSD